MVITGRAVLVSVGLALITALRPQWSTVFAVVVVLLLVLVIDGWRAVRPSKIALERGGDTAVRVGDAATVSLRLTNRSQRQFIGTVRDAWPPSSPTAPRTHGAQIAAGDRRALTTTLVPSRRGPCHADKVTIRSLGPLGLAGRQLSRSVPWRVDVLPAFSSRKHLPSKLAKLRDLEGRTVVLQRGQGTEFDSLREYVVGDDVRSIDWRATARASDVMVRTWRPERDRHVLIVLDCGRTAAGRVGDAPRLDASMEATLLLTALATRAGDHVDVLAWDRRARGAVQGRSGSDLMAATTLMLAQVQASLVETDWQGLASEVTRRARRRSLVVLLTALDPTPIHHGLLPVLPQLTRRHQIVVASVSDPSVAEMLRERSDIASTYRAAAAAGFTRERHAVSDTLRQIGVEVVDELPDDLAPGLADRYLALKTQGRL
ncbi:MAG: DUF58 domain-containing protein [Actinomycetes bacterium]